MRGIFKKRFKGLKGENFEAFLGIFKAALGDHFNIYNFLRCFCGGFCFIQASA